MLVNWLKKKIVKSLIDDAVKQLPELRKKAISYWEENEEEILGKVKDKLIELIAKG